MMDMRKVLEKEINGLSVKLFEYNIEDNEKFEQVKAYLIDKVRKSKVHNIGEYDLTYYIPNNLDPKFIEKFNKSVSMINIPKRAKMPQFDVRRERVTEWMAQCLLEQECGCRFYDEADKRMNIKTVEIDKHTDGIDVPGIWIDNEDIRFVVCEVKASEEKKIPCNSVKGLQDDIQKAIDNSDNRVTREILEYMHGIRNIKVQDDILKKIIEFLAKLIAGEEKNLVDNILFFPFLIRNNQEIVLKKNIDDFKDFSLERVNFKNVENIILSFGQSFSNFGNEIYKRAIGDE